MAIHRQGIRHSLAEARRGHLRAWAPRVAGLAFWSRVSVVLFLIVELSRPDRVPFVTPSMLLLQPGYSDRLERTPSTLPW